MKLCRDEVLMVLYKWCYFSARSAKGGAKIGHGVPSSRNFFRPDATTTNQMHSNDLEACGTKCCYFWFHKVKFMTRFDVFVHLVILP